MINQKDKQEWIKIDVKIYKKDVKNINNRSQIY